MATNQSFLTIFCKIDIETFKKISHLCLDELCGRRGAQYENFQDSSNCSAEEFAVAVTGIKSLLNKMIKMDYSKSVYIQYPDDKWCELATSYPTYLECLHKCMEERLTDVLALRTQTCAKIKGPTLKDFNWKLKWVLGSSSLASLQQPLMSLDLHLSDGARHSLEMDSQELSKLITALEKARDTMNKHALN